MCQVVAYGRWPFMRGSSLWLWQKIFLVFCKGGFLWEVVAYGRWSHMEVRLYLCSPLDVSECHLLRLFTIYMGKLVGPWFGQLVPKIQDWYISSRICIYYLYKSGILHNLCTPQTSTVRHYWPICWSTLDRHISWLSVDMLLDTRSICWPVHWPTYQLTCRLTLDRVSAWSTVM